MHETPADLEQLQELLDSSYARAGKNLRDIHAQGRHLTAVELAHRLDGPRWLVVATVNSHNRPFTAQVDGTFYRGHFYFGVNDPWSLKARHLIRNPAISATHVPDDTWTVTVHGRGERVDVGRDGDVDLHRVLIDT
ncbi:MAG: pyridoxamine 5'-phosphate oxidase family protein, partial [Candidatus Dormibacteria bacterium]